MCQTSTPSCWGDKEAYYVIVEPPFEVEDVSEVEDAAGNMYQWYIFLQ